MNKSESIFAPIFRDQWERLPSVFQKHYANHPFTTDEAIVEGKMDITISKLMCCFTPFLKWFNVLVPYQGRDIPVTVRFCSKQDSSQLHLLRTFYFPNKNPYEFNSCMQVMGKEDVIERMKFGLGWRMRYFYDGTKVIMQHKHYVLKIMKWWVPLPLEIIMGKGYAEEEVIDANTYRVTMMMRHALLGELYRYEGNFTFTSLVS